MFSFAQALRLALLVVTVTAIDDPRCSTTPTVVVMYDSGDQARTLYQLENSNISNFHTYQLANAISKGLVSAGVLSNVYNVSNVNAPTKYSDLAKVHAVAIGTPVYFANPSAATLEFIYRSLGPGWNNRTFADLPCAVFATGGGYHQGTEGTLQGLTRAMLNFGFRPVTPNVVINGYYSSLGASAVTGTPPYFVNTDPISQQFLDVGIALGHKLGIETRKEWAYRCGRVLSL